MLDNPDVYTYTINEEDHKTKRVDKLLSDRFPELSRSLISKLIDDNKIFYLKNDEKIILINRREIPLIGTTLIIDHRIEKEATNQPENIPLEILYEDEHIIIINKQAGLVVHPASGNWTGTLVNAILHHCPTLKGVGNEKRPGIVHRLDKGTSGVMIVAKTNTAHERLVSTFSEHNIKRIYIALINGALNTQSKKVESFIRRNPTNRLKMQSHKADGKKAITYFKTLNKFKNFSLLECQLETGRTHQIRVHLSQDLHLPILNDKTYGRNREAKFLNEKQLKIISDYEYPFLHAKTLGLNHPITNEYIEFSANPPNVFQSLLNALD